VTQQAARRERNVLAMITGFVLAGAAMLALAAGQRVGLVASLAFLALVLVGRRFARRYIDASARWLRGAHAERAVGDTLNALRMPAQRSFRWS
jgi:hypothetical protein